MTHRDSTGARTNLPRKDELKRKTILVIGSSGLVGSEAVEYFDRQGHRVIGADNNMRRVFFGRAGDTTWVLERLRSITQSFISCEIDIRDAGKLREILQEHRFDLIVHIRRSGAGDRTSGS